MSTTESPSCPVPAQSQARRKSCVACTRAKRRCDLGVPVCSRCTERQLDCVYVPVVSNRRRRAVQSALPQQPQAQQHAPCSSPVAAAVSLNDLEFDAFCDEALLRTPEDMTTEDITPKMTSVQIPQRLARSTAPASGFDMMNCIFSANFDNAASTVCSATTPALPLLLDFTEEVITTDDNSSSNYFTLPPEFDMIKALVPVLYPKPFPAFPYSPQPVGLITPYTGIDPRLHYAMEHFRSALTQMVTECHTPWSHRRLYTEHTMDGRLPTSIAAAQACCALHIARNRTNSVMITRNIVQMARQVCREPPLSHTSSSDSGSSRSKNSPAKGEDTATLALLAHTQALFLFHIMLQTNTDPLARDTLPHICRALGSAAMALHKRTTALSSPYITDSEPPPIKWKTSHDRYSGYQEEDSDGLGDVQEVDRDNSPWFPAGTGNPAAPRNTTTTTSSATTTSSPSSSPPPKSMPPFLPLSPLHQTRPVYQSWILHESCRRTVLAAGIFQILQQLLGTNANNQHTLQCPGGNDDMRDTFCVSPFTVSRECWDEARDCVDFAAGWNRSGWTVLRAADFEHGLTTLNAHHVDAFSRLVLSLLFGIDETKGWLLSRGAVTS